MSTSEVTSISPLTSDVDIPQIANTNLALMYLPSASAYFIASHQYTLTTHHNEVLFDILKPDVVDAIKAIERDLSKYPTINNHSITLVSSGMWVGDPKSRWYNEQLKHAISTKNNVELTGDITGGNIKFMLMYYGKKFVITNRGAVYRLS